MDWLFFTKKKKKTHKIINSNLCKLVTCVHRFTVSLGGVRFDKNNFRRHLSTCDKTLYLSLFASLVKLNINISQLREPF